jgi:hypothetical protein
MDKEEFVAKFGEGYTAKLDTLDPKVREAFLEGCGMFHFSHCPEDDDGNWLDELLS